MDREVFRSIRLASNRHPVGGRHASLQFEAPSGIRYLVVKRAKTAGNEKKESIQKDRRHATTRSGSATNSEHWREFHLLVEDKPPPFTSKQLLQENYFALPKGIKRGSEPVLRAKRGLRRGGGLDCMCSTECRRPHDSHTSFRHEGMRIIKRSFSSSTSTMLGFFGGR